MRAGQLKLYEHDEICLYPLTSDHKGRWDGYQLNRKVNTPDDKVATSGRRLTPYHMLLKINHMQRILPCFLRIRLTLPIVRLTPPEERLTPLLQRLQKIFRRLLDNV